MDSTNRVLLERARHGAPAGQVLVADHQTAGRGRLDRRWDAEPGAALLVSVLLRPRPGDAVHLLGLAGGVAAVEACRALSPAAVGLKWPNDVVVDGRKLAGVLVETIVADGRVAAAVVGMGLNLRAPDPHVGAAVGLDELTHDPVDREDVLRLWLDALERGVAAGPALVPAYRGCCTTLGQQVRVVQPGGELHGLAADIDDRGRLVVDTDGGLVAVDVGDVTHVRT